MSKCKKHDCGYETRQMEHGKTMQVCPECEKEQINKFREMFGFTNTPMKPEFPGINPIQKE